MSTKAKSPRKPLTPAQKAANEDRAASNAGTGLDVSKITEAVNKGEFDKARELADAIPEELISPENRKQLHYEIHLKEKPAIKKETDQSIRPVKKPKVIEFDDVLKKWQDSVDILKAYRDQQQKAGKAFTHIHVGYHRSNQFMLRFNRNKPK